nr:hypothetical protein CFP56_20494 [Quercus suber]
MATSKGQVLKARMQGLLKSRLPLSVIVTLSKDSFSRGAHCDPGSSGQIAMLFATPRLLLQTLLQILALFDYLNNAAVRLRDRQLGSCTEPLAAVYFTML